MKIKTIHIGIGRTYNIGNFESFRVDGAIDIELEEGEVPRDSWSLAYGILREQMRSTFKEFKPVRKSHVRDKFFEIKDRHGTEAARALIKSLGYDKLEDLVNDPEILQEAYEAAREALRR